MPRRSHLAPVFLPVSLALLLSTCSGRTPAPEPDPPAPPPPVRITYAIALHGGAGVRQQPGDEAAEYRRSLSEALTLGRDLLAEGSASLRVVEQVVRFLEDDPKFNAGKGAVFTNAGTHELDAAIMDGRTLACGAVAGLKRIRNPVSLARLVMERSGHVLLIGDGAEQFARDLRVPRVNRSYFYTRDRYQEWVTTVREGGGGSVGYGTVGAVALDRYGNLAAATSTGGMTNKRFGRVGDVPLIGAGTYANNGTAAISCTGRGEELIRHGVAHEISAQIEHAGRSLLEAAQDVVHKRLQSGDGGLIGIDADGSIAMVFNSPGMYRAAADSTGRFEVAIWPDEAPAEESDESTSEGTGAASSSPSL